MEEPSMKHVLAYDFEQYLDWLKKHGFKDNVDAKFISGIHQLVGLTPDNKNELVELNGWRETKTGQFINEVEWRKRFKAA